MLLLFWNGVGGIQVTVFVFPASYIFPDQGNFAASLSASLNPQDNDRDDAGDH